MTFGQVLSRGFSAANRSIVGFVLLMFLYGTFQASSLVVGGLMSPESMVVQPGQPPSPEFAMLIGYGCASCIWMLVMVFAGPYVLAGIVGQLRDRIQNPGDDSGRFTGYSGRFYLPMLVLTLIFSTIICVLYLGAGLASSAVMFDQMGGMQPEQIQEFQKHPVSLAAGLFAMVLVIGVSVIFNLANSIVVIEYMDAFTALGRAFEFVRRQILDATKLWVVSGLLALFLWSVYWTVQFLELHSLPLLLVFGAVVGIYVPYMILLIQAWSVSLWLARTPASSEDIAGAESPIGDSDQPVSDSSI